MGAAIATHRTEFSENKEEFAPSGAGGLHPSRKPRQPARDRIGMEHTLGYGALHFRLGCAKRLLRRSLVARLHRFFDLAQKTAHTRLARLVAHRALFGLTDALPRGRIIGHGLSVRT